VTFDAVEIAIKSWNDVFLNKSHNWVCLVFCSALTTGLSNRERFIASNETSSFGEKRYEKYYYYFDMNMFCVILTLCIAGVELTLSKSKLLRSVKLPFIDKLVFSIQLRLCTNTGPVSAINKIEMLLLLTVLIHIL